MQMAEALQLSVGLVHNFFGWPGFFEAPAQFADLLFAAFFAFAEFLLDGFELLAQKGVALGVGEMGGNVFLDFLLELGDFELGGDAQEHGADAFDDVEFFEQILLLGDVQGEAAGEQVSEPAGVFQNRVAKGQDGQRVGNRRRSIFVGLSCVGPRRAGFGRNQGIGIHTQEERVL